MDNTEIYELNLTTKEVKKATYKPGSFFASSGPEGLITTETWLLEMKEGCKYFNALNQRNAERKSKKITN